MAEEDRYSSPLQKGPIGLLEAFRLKTLGRQPTRFGDLVAPSTDVVDFYLAQQFVGGQATSGPNTIPQSVQVVTTVPGRYWSFGCSIQIGAAAGAWLSARLYIRVPSSAGNRMYVGALNVVPIATAIYSLTSDLPAPIVLDAGATFGCELQGNAGGADHSMTFNYLFQTLTGN